MEGVRGWCGGWARGWGGGVGGGRDKTGQDKIIVL